MPGLWPWSSPGLLSIFFMSKAAMIDAIAIQKDDSAKKRPGQILSNQKKKEIFDKFSQKT